MSITKVSRNLLNTGVSDSSDATAITINSSEQVGIGTAIPVATLQVKTQTNGNLAFQNSTSVTGGVKLNCFNDAANASYLKLMALVCSLILHQPSKQELILMV